MYCTRFEFFVFLAENGVNVQPFKVIRDYSKQRNTIIINRSFNSKFSILIINFKTAIWELLKEQHCNEDFAVFPIE